VCEAISVEKHTRLPGRLGGSWWLWSLLTVPLFSDTAFSSHWRPNCCVIHWPWYVCSLIHSVTSLFHWPSLWHHPTDPRYSIVEGYVVIHYAHLWRALSVYWYSLFVMHDTLTVFLALGDAIYIFCCCYSVRHLVTTFLTWPLSDILRDVFWNDTQYSNFICIGVMYRLYLNVSNVISMAGLLIIININAANVYCININVNIISS